MVFLTSNYVSITTRKISTNQVVEGASFSGENYLLLEITNNNIFTAIGPSTGILVELTPYTKALYTSYDVYDFDSNTKIGTYRFSANGNVLFYIDTIYQAFGKVKLKLVNPRLGTTIHSVDFIEEVKIYTHDKTLYPMPVAQLTCSISKSVYLEGESVDYDDVTMSAIYIDGSINNNVTNYTYDILSPLTVDDEFITFTHADASQQVNIKVLPKENLNLGLKPYTKQFSDNIGNISFNANLYQLHGNMHIILPIFNTVGYSPINLSLIYNQQDGININEFGYGFRLNYCNSLEVNNTVINVHNSDGSIDIYNKSSDDINKYENTDTSNYIIKDYDGELNLYKYTLYDLNGNNIVYIDSNMRYPKNINFVSGESLTFSFDENDNISEIRNLNNDVVTFNKSNGLVNTITWTHDNTILLTATITYNLSILARVIVRNKNQMCEAYYTINFANNITITDLMTGDFARIKYISNRLTEYTKGFNNSIRNTFKTVIDYSDYKTIVSDTLGNNVTYVFDADGVLRYEVDNKNNFISYNFDKNLKKYTQVTPLNTDYITSNKNLLCGVTLNDFTKNEISVHEYTSEVFNYYSLIPTDFYEAKGTGCLEYSLNYQYKTSDMFTLVMWVKQTKVASDTSNCRITLSLLNESVSRVTDKTVIDNEYYPIVLGCVAKQSHDCINIKLEFVGSASIVVAGITLLNKSFGAFYQYDENGNMIGKQVGRRETNYTYNHSNMLDESLSSSSKMESYGYDNKNNVIEILGSYHVRTLNQYDSKNRLVNSIIRNYNNEKVLSTSTTYNTDFDVSYYDELNNQTRVVKDNYGNVVTVTNALSQIISFNYYETNKLKEIILSKNDNEKTISYTYDLNHHDKILTASLSGGCTYTFGYDSLDRLTTISNDEGVLVTYAYDLYDRIVSLYYNVNSDCVSFNYNNDNTINTISLGNETYSYNYDNYGNVTTILLNNDPYKTFIYDIDNKLTKIIYNDDNTKYIDYEYDNLDNLIETDVNIGNSRVINAYSHLYRSNGCNPESLKNLFNLKYYTCMFIDGDLNLSGPEGYIHPTIIGSSSTMRSGIIPCYGLTGTNRLTYNISSPYTSYGSYGAWIKPHYQQPSINLLSIESSSGEYIKVLNDSQNKVIVKMKNSSGQIVTAVSPNLQLENCFNFIGLNWSCTNGITTVNLFINGNCYTSELNYTMSLGAETGLILGEDIIGLISALIYGYDKLLTDGELLEFYRTTRDYIFSKEVSTYGYDFSNTTSYIVPNDVEIFPLQNNLKSLNNIEPIDFNYRVVSSYDRDRTFNFNIKSKRYAYVADGGLLEYCLNSSSSCTLGMNIYIDSVTTKQKVFEFKDSNDKVLGLYVNQNKEIIINSTDFIIETNLGITLKEWNYVALSINKISSDLYSLRVFVNSSVFEVNNIQMIFDAVSSNVIVGKGYNEQLDNDILADYPLYGLIEMMVFKNSYLSLSEMEELKNSITQTTLSTGYDELGLEVSKTLSVNNNNIMTKLNSYKTRKDDDSNADDKYISPYINKETFYFNNAALIRNYEFDNLGNVKSIINSNSAFNNHTYFYDYRGYLQSDNTETYTYDNNGNILSRGSTIYEYNSSNKDKLTKVDGKEISYEGNYSLNPSSWNGITFSWEGRRLIHYNKEELDIYYKYDDKGQRISKKIGNNVINYFYDNGKLVKEINTNYSLDYMYDEHNMLFGFVYGNNKYYYIRDMLQNIIGIIDNNGNLIVEYNYNAYGNNMTISGDITIGTINPFRYKGYYYDSETQLYWVSSRYYSPELCRWISPDSIEYLDPQSINGLNLYCYCGNNPVNYKQRPVSSGGLAGNRISGNSVKPISKTLSSKSSGFNLFGYELRTSAGWDTSPDIATSFFGRIGFSSYVTHTQGQSGMLYAFAGSTSDVMNWFGTTYYAGVGINLFDIVGVEAYLETVGIGAQVSIGNFSIGANINLIGGTSITFGWDTDLGNGLTKTDGFTVGVNTGCLVAVIYWIYKFVTTGDPSPVPGLQPAY